MHAVLYSPYMKTLQVSPEDQKMQLGIVAIRRRCCALCCYLMERHTALGSETQGNNIASGFFRCMPELLVHAIYLCLCSTSKAAKTHLWLMAFELCLDTHVAIYGGSF